MNEGIDIYGDNNDLNVIQEIRTPIVIARIIDEVGVRKSALPVFKIYTLAILAGTFIAFESIFFAVVMAGNTGSFGLHLFAGGAAFS
jgi:formate/nitrite transporter FocA (FNT family)